MRTSWARLAIGVAVAGGLTVATAGIASAHNLGMSGAAVCLDGGGWQATATLTLDDNPGNPPPVTGTVTASYPSGRAAQPFAVQATESATFGQGTVVPVDIPSVTFTVTGTFGDGYAFTSDVVVTQPVDCEPTTTSSTTTSTTTAPPTTEPRTATTVAPVTSTTTSPTTSTTTPTTTTVPEILSITAITPVCMRDVPYVRVVFGDQPQYDGRTATITFLDVRGIEVARHTAPFAANASVTFIYPGAGVDAGGRATDWPGWAFDGDDWVPDPTDRHLRDGLTVRVEVNPTAVGQVAYPPETSACANPPASDDGALPSTGSSPAPILWVAAGILAVGGFLVLRATLSGTVEREGVTVQLTELAQRLVPFCRARYDDPALTVSEVVTMPGHAGFAYGFAVDHHGGTDRWFLRLPPPGVRWEGTADMLRQVTALQALDGGDVPHCHVQWYGGSDDLDWFGCPYFVVEQLVDGDVITFGGRDSWVRALSDERRRDMGRQAMDALAAIHRTAWHESCGYLGEPLSLERDVTRWDRFVERAADPDALADVPRLRRLLLERLPGDVPIGLFHGDFQFSNLYFTAAGELRAVLDWELCGIGATLNDVGWVATFNDPRAWQHHGAVPDGMPRADELLADYAAAWGGPLPDLSWFRALAAYKFAIIAGFNLGLHRRGKRPDPLWERIGQSIPSLQGRALELLTA